MVPDNFGTQNIPSQYVPTDEIRHALTTLNIEGPQPSNPPITPECFRRNFKRWADLLEPIMSTAITLGYFNENLGWVTAPEPGSGSSQLAMLAYQAIIIVTQAHARDHPHVVLEPGSGLGSTSIVADYSFYRRLFLAVLHRLVGHRRYHQTS